MAETSVTPSPRSEAEIRDWLVTRVAEATQMDRADIKVDEPLLEIGLDSMQFVVIVGELEDWLGCKFTSNPLAEFPTIQALTSFLAAQSSMQAKVVEPRT